jgi:hypothetical protein
LKQCCIVVHSNECLLGRDHIPFEEAEIETVDYWPENKKAKEYEIWGGKSNKCPNILFCPSGHSGAPEFTIAKYFSFPISHVRNTPTASSQGRGYSSISHTLENTIKTFC